MSKTASVPYAADPIDGWVDWWASTDRCALIFEDERISYEHLARRIGAVAQQLIEAGVEPGDRVVFCGLNRVELFETLFACARLGAILCPINNRLTAGEVATLLADCRPRLMVTSDGFDSLLTEAEALIEISPPIRDLDTQPFPDRATPTPIATGSIDDPLLMVYTSGTTGDPKGAVLTQEAIGYTARNGIAHQRLTGEDSVIAPLPTFHVGGLNIQTLPTLLVGGTVILQRRFDPGGVLDLIARYRPTQTLLVPAMLQAVAAHATFADTDLSCLAGINTGSSLVPDSVVRPYLDRGVSVGQVYGTTETGPTAVVLGYEEAADHAGSCGKPASHTELRLVDEAGVDVGPGQPGEIWIRGRHLFSHYWDKPSATKEAFVDDWYRTGDIGSCDDDGYLFISDRVTDVVISGGENIYPAEVEAQLVEHPLIDEVAVIGQADERWGESPLAVVVTTDAAAAGSLTIGTLRAWCEGRLASYKRPRGLLIVDELPRTALGKVRKHVLREQIAESSN